MKYRPPKFLLPSLLFVIASSLIALGQEPAQSPDVIKVFTELVRTDVMVFDKEGRFVTGLKQKDFEIKIDGKLRELQSLDQVVAGTPGELAEFSDSRERSVPAVTDATALEDASERKRTVLFLVDDLHMDQSGLALMRQTLTNFIEKDMSYNTEAAIVSASGQIGFLQQLTDNKEVLRAALKRITLTHFKAEDVSQPKMREIDALLISQRDPEITNYFIEATMRLNLGMTRESAALRVEERSRSILQQADNLTKRTLASLDQLVVTAGKSPGRKLLVLVSDGFLFDHLNSDVSERAQQITGLAARSGVVIYSMQSLGLVAPMSDPTGLVDQAHRLDRADSGEVWYRQEGMNLLAKDTGGKTVFNTNDLSAGVQKALRDTSIYYLLTWKPEPGLAEPNKFRKISVSVIGRPDLTVRVRKGFYGGGSSEIASTKGKPVAAAPPDPKTELRKVLLEPFSQRQVPLSIALNYVVTPDKKVSLSTSIQIARSAISFAADDSGKQTGAVDIASVIYDDKGRPGGQVNDRLSVQTEKTETAEQSGTIVSTYPIKLGPGLYQVRVAVRDERSGRMGNANAWVEIPDLTTPKLSLSSLIMGDGKDVSDPSMKKRTRDPLDQVNLNVDRRYLQNSNLRLMLFAYNARLAENTSEPDVAIKIEVLHNDKAVISAPFKPISTKGITDLAQLPYAADIPLSGLARGLYELKVTVLDRLAKNSVSQTTLFEID